MNSELKKMQCMLFAMKHMKSVVFTPIGSRLHVVINGHCSQWKSMVSDHFVVASCYV